MDGGDEGDVLTPEFETGLVVEKESDWGGWGV